MEQIFNKERMTKSLFLKGVLCWLTLIFSTVTLAKIHTNQDMIESLSIYDKLDSTDIDAVFKTVLDNIPNNITVYPTEGYYYFWFYHQGNLIRGNLRFDHNLVDKGQVSFAYYYDIEGRGGQGSETRHKVYTSTDGLILKKIAPRRYQLSFGGSSKTVTLNIPTSDYKSVADEAFLGNMQDESGVIFTFIFNHKLKQFYYLLDQSQNYEHYYELSPHISVGARTGFVYFQDSKRAQPRKILVGVVSQNSALNNFYDGPFDQLPDHQLGSTLFKDYVSLVYPLLKGKVSSHGHLLGKENARVAINNYIHYRDLEVFKYLEQCHQQSIKCVQNFITLSKS